MNERGVVLGRIGVRAVAGLAGLAATACVVTAALSWSAQGAQAKPESRVVTPVPATATAACPGPLLSLDTSGASKALTAVGAPSVVSGAGDSSAQTMRVAAPDVVSDGSAPQAFRAPAVDSDTEPLLAAAQTLTGSGDELHGLAAANCAQPDYDSWLVGGSSALGATTLVVLMNPGDVAATVDLDVYSERGAVDAAGAHGISVRPHAQHVVPLAGLAPNASSTVVHVVSTGSAVSAQLQESQVTGVTPQGVEWVGPTAGAAKHVVVPGAVVDTSALTNGTGSDGGDSGVPVLRVLPIGDKDAKLTISAKPETGSKGGTASTVTVSHGVVSEVPLDRLGGGTFTITVDSDVPIVAAVRSTTVDKKNGADFAWYSAAEPLRGAAAIPVAPGPNAELHFVNPGDAAVTIKLTGAGTRSVTVPAGGSVFLKPTAAGVFNTSDAHGVFASLSYWTKGQLAAYPAYPTGASAAALTVNRR
jgi:hypothetical protein